MTWELRQGHVLDRLREMPDESVHCVVTSPPYWGLRDYGVEPVDWPAMSFALPGGVIDVPAMTCCFGLEETPEQFIGHAVLIFGELRRVLRSDGTLWVNIGDSYAGRTDRSRSATNHHDRKAVMPPRTTGLSGDLKVKDLVGVPWMLAFALRAEGWYLRAENIWHKPTPMPEAVHDRTTRAHEQIFHLAKAPRYFYDADAVRTPLAAKTLTAFGSTRERNGGGDLVKSDNWARDVPNREAKRGADGRPVGANLRSVWSIASKRFADAHFATFPPDLVEPCIKAGTSPKVCGECGAPWRRGDGPRRMDMSRPQARRAIALVAEHGLTDAHIEAIRACGVTDAGKAQHTQSGFGNNDVETQALADEAKAALGGYYREFLLARPSGGALEPTCDHTDDSGRAVVLDPFAGAATTLLVATQLGRDSIGIELNPEYVELGEQRIRRWEADPAGHLRRQEPVEAQGSLLDMEQTLA